MTDKELLELAAKAAGIDCEVEVFGNGRCVGTNEYNEIVFDPLTDDGDALRLAVKLRMRTHHDGSCANAELSTGQKHCWTEAAVVESNDHYAATRRAIVRAAAEIGKEMK